MLESIRRGYETLAKMPSSAHKDRQLAKLMTEMEQHYSIPMNKARFEAEVPSDVRELYLAISKLREMK